VAEAHHQERREHHHHQHSTIIIMVCHTGHSDEEDIMAELADMIRTMDLNINHVKIMGLLDFFCFFSVLFSYCHLQEQ